MTVVSTIGLIIIALFGVLFYLDVKDGKAYREENFSKMLKYNMMIACVLTVISILGLFLFVYMIIFTKV
jgi:heme/copper-type cytochrome/quinol oxidase subunit 2